MEKQENLDFFEQFEDVFFNKESLGNLIDLSLFGLLLEFNVCGNDDSTTITPLFTISLMGSKRTKKVNYFACSFYG